MVGRRNRGMKPDGICTKKEGWESRMKKEEKVLSRYKMMRVDLRGRG